MVRDPECTVVGTFSGAMSVAKMGLLICEMIDRGWLKVIVTTGALIAHGFIETLGRAHHKYPEQVSDRQLFQQGYNRIYDTLEMESNLDYAEDVFRAVLEGLDPDEVWSSASLCRGLGKYLAEQSDSPGILRSAYLKGVPVFIPAFTDSELGLDLAGHMVRRALGEGKDIGEALGAVSLKFNPFLDLAAYTQKALASPKLGIFTVGGGVPRNWAQQVAPYLELLHSRLDLGLPEVRFHYGVRLCPEPAHWGGLERLHLQGGGLLGQVCLFGGRRPLCRGAVRRHHRLAAPAQGRQPASRQSANGLTTTRGELSGQTGIEDRNSGDQHHEKQRRPQRQLGGVNSREAL